MQIKEFIAKYTNHPVLFIGTGLSLRYLKNSYSWDNLLKQIILDVTKDEEDYLNIKSRHQKEGYYQYPEIAKEVEDFFNRSLEKDRNGRFKTVNDRFFEGMKKGENVSRFKIYIADLLKNTDFKTEKKEELSAFTKIRKNISSIITTNYDNFIEEVFTFKPLIGNDILLSNPYGSVYKIHGCVTKPSSIIITSKDYEAFENKYELIRAQLLSLFIHNPIIFIGYNLSDNNIKSILRTIFSYVDANSSVSERIRNNFLVVEYKENEMKTDVVEFDVVIDSNTSIRINKIKTDNFEEIYNALSELHLPISAMDVRKVQSIVGDIYAGTNGIKVYITEDIDSLANGDKVIAIGSKKTINYQYLTQKEMLADYFAIMEEANAQRISIIDKYPIQSSQYFPIYGFSTINHDLVAAEKLKQNQYKKISDLREKLNEKRKVHNSHTTIEDIENDSDIPMSSKNMAIAYGIISKQIPLDTLETYLKSFSPKGSTDYNRLLVLYDYMKYGENSAVEA